MNKLLLPTQAIFHGVDELFEMLGQFNSNPETFLNYPILYTNVICTVYESE